MNNYNPCCQTCGNELFYEDGDICDECEDELFQAGEIQCSVCAEKATWNIMGVYLCPNCTLEEYQQGIRYG